VTAIGLWLWVHFNPAALRYVALSPDAKVMAEDMYRALWSWLVCVIVTVVVSLATQPRPEAELAGLVYGATRLPEEHDDHWYQKPIVWASMIAVIFVVLNVIFCRRQRMRGHIQIWFFSGILLLTYGVLIFCDGVVGTGASTGPGSGALAAARADLVGRHDDRGGTVLHCSVSSPLTGWKRTELNHLRNALMKKQLTFDLLWGTGDFPRSSGQRGPGRDAGGAGEGGIRAITLEPEQSKFGSVETHDDAIKCGDLFRAHRDEIDGIIVTLPNFGDERGIADSIRYSTLECRCWCRRRPTAATT